MDRIINAQRELAEMDTLAAMESPVHRLHPLSKFITTILYIFVVVSFDKYDLTGIAVMILFPVVMYQAAGIPVSTCFRKLKIVLPLVCAVGIVNPFLDHTPVIRLGTFLVTGGMVSMVTLMLKGVFSLMASFLLIATTSIDSLCAALRMIRVPDLLTTLLLLTYRYIGVMVREVGIMTQAYSLRAPGQKGIHISAWGSFLGQLLLRSMDRAQELYSSMLLRGFNGNFYYADIPHWTTGTWLFTLLSCTAIVLCRVYNIPTFLGNLMMR